MKKVFVGCVLTATFLLGCSSSSDNQSSDTQPSDSVEEVTAQVVEVNITIGENSGPNTEQRISLGSTVRMTLINSTDADEIHVHGYDISTGAMSAGEPAVIEFLADTAGTFEVESHVSEEVVLLLIVE